MGKAEGNRLKLTYGIFVLNIKGKNANIPLAKNWKCCGDTIPARCVWTKNCSPQRALEEPSCLWAGKWTERSSGPSSDEFCHNLGFRAFSPFSCTPKAWVYQCCFRDLPLALTSRGRGRSSFSGIWWHFFTPRWMGISTLEILGLAGVLAFSPVLHNPEGVHMAAASQHASSQPSSPSLHPPQP